MDLVFFPDDRLSTATKAVESLTESHKSLIDQMKLAMVEYNAQGIAANQLGADSSILCILYNKQPLIMINPSFEKLGTETVQSKEGCLSFPGVSLSINRFASCRAHFLTERFEPCVLVLEDIDAVAFQHELDHLHGVVMVDRVGRLERRNAFKRLQKTKKKYSL